MPNPNETNAAQPPINPKCDGSKRKINSQQLFATQNEIVIDHLGEEYRLRITSNGKLILTK